MDNRNKFKSYKGKNSPLSFINDSLNISSKHTNCKFELICRDLCRRYLKN